MVGITPLHKDHFFVLAVARSGSTWLQQTLDAHPDVTCLFEPSNTRFNRILQRAEWIWDAEGAMSQAGGVEERLMDCLPLRFNYGVDRLDLLLRATPTRLAGAKITWLQLFRHLDPTTFFIRYRDSRCILLGRSSLVDAMCSWMVAKRTRLWNSESNWHMNLMSFSVSPERAERYIVRFLLHQELLRTYVRTMAIRHVEVTYEELMGETESALSHIAAFLGIDEINDHSRLRRLIPRSYREFIINYDELVELENAARKRNQ